MYDFRLVILYPPSVRRIVSGLRVQYRSVLGGGVLGLKQRYKGDKFYRLKVIRLVPRYVHPGGVLNPLVMILANPDLYHQ